MADAREGRARFPAYSWVAGWLNAQALYRVILPFCDHAVVQSEQMREDVLNRGADARRLSVVPMGIPDEDVPDPSPMAAEAAEREQIVLYLGTFARVRKLEMIVRAFALVAAGRPGARLVLVGDGDVPADRVALEEEIARLRIADRVTLTGMLPRSQALAWVRRATVCLSPYYPTFVLRSTSPTKLVEYLALGKAVVANDHPEQAQILAESGAGGCVPWDEARFAQEIGRLLDDPGARARAAERGYRWVVENRRYSVIAAALRARYDLIVPRP
jgi:glycosyltransferase involved in cell wall biosynthesis